MPILNSIVFIMFLMHTTVSKHAEKHKNVMYKQEKYQLIGI